VIPISLRPVISYKIHLADICTLWAPSSINLFMMSVVFDPSPLTLCIYCCFLCCCFITISVFFIPHFSKFKRVNGDFHFQNDGFPPSWIFKISKLYWLIGSRWLGCITIHDFVEIAQSVAKIIYRPLLSVQIGLSISKWRVSGAHVPQNRHGIKCISLLVLISQSAF